MRTVRYTEAPARREELLRRLTAQGYVSSSQLAQELDVSEMTIRRDLRQLHLEGQARRVVGGASLPASLGHGLPFEERNQAESAQKQAIARTCASLLVDDATIVLDAGTTVAPLAGLIEPGVLVITHSVPVITGCTARDDLELVALGGVYQSDTRSFTGPTTRANLENLAADVAVLSATALDATGVLCANSLDAEIKRSMAAIATRRILLVDHSKLGARAPIRFGTLSLIDVVITDWLATGEQLAAITADGTQVIVAGESAS